MVSGADVHGDTCRSLIIWVAFLFTLLTGIEETVASAPHLYDIYAGRGIIASIRIQWAL